MGDRWWRAWVLNDPIRRPTRIIQEYGIQLGRTKGCIAEFQMRYADSRGIGDALVL